MSKAGKSRGRRRVLFRLLGDIFDKAVIDEYLKSSPIPKLDNQRGKKGSGDKKVRILTYLQAQRLLKEAESDPDVKLVVMLGLLAGLRRGEMFALDFADIDWEHDRILIRRNCIWCYGKHHQRKDGEPRFKLLTPKTKNSIRAVDLSAKLKDLLWNRWMEMQVQGKTGLVLQAKPGVPIEPGNFQYKRFQPIVDRILEEADRDLDEETMKAFDGLMLHHLRHTFASWKISEGVDVAYVSQQLGHANVAAFTYSLYVHGMSEQRPEATRLTDEKLFGKVLAQD
jgi:integrase